MQGNGFVKFDNRVLETEFAVTVWERGFFPLPVVGVIPESRCQRRRLLRGTARIGFNRTGFLIFILFFSGGFFTRTSNISLRSGSATSRNQNNSSKNRNCESHSSIVAYPYPNRAVITPEAVLKYGCCPVSGRAIKEILLVCVEIWALQHSPANPQENSLLPEKPWSADHLLIRTWSCSPDRTSSTMRPSTVTRSPMRRSTSGQVCPPVRAKERSSGTTSCSGP